MKKAFIILALIAVTAIGVFIYQQQNNQKTEEEIFLPGTQPEVVTNFIISDQCKMCHQTKSKDNSPYDTWQGSLMGHAGRDPLYLAAQAVANQDIPNAGDFCIRCHYPVGWLEGRSKPFDGSKLTSVDGDGLFCDFCHRMVDPLSDETKTLLKDKDVPHDYGNGMFVASPQSSRRGPYKDSSAPHITSFSEFHKKGEFCGTCHDVTNPVNKLPIERTFSEWKKSDFAKQGESGSCQSCHMKSVSGFAADSVNAGVNVPYRKNLPVHDLTGGSNWIFDALPLLWKNLNVDNLQAGKKRAENLLKTAASLKISAEKKSGKVFAKVRIYNNTGHKLPTGYPEGRRMWINIKGVDSSENIIFESGKFNKDSAILTKDPQIKIYEAKQGIKDKGETFHFVLNNYIVKDNRIPPKGFANKVFDKVGASVIDYKYSDGQYWDDTVYEMPNNIAKIEVELLYQSSSKEYIEFLKGKNKTDDWGKKLYNAWVKTGKSSPVKLAYEKIQL